MLHYDDSEHPFVRMTITGFTTAETSRACMDRMAALLDAGTRFILVVDDRSAGGSSSRWPSLRALRWAVEHWERLKRMCAGAAIVVDEQRLARTPRAARSLLPPMPVPVSIFGDVGMAEAWAQSRLVASQVRDAVDVPLGCHPTTSVARHPVSSADGDAGW